MKCDEVLNILEEFIDDELLGTPKVEVEEHLKQCDSCQSQHHSLDRLRELLHALPQPKPPNFLEEAILTEIKNSPPPRRVHFPIGFQFLAAAVVLFCFTLFVTSSLKNYRQNQNVTGYSTTTAKADFKKKNQRERSLQNRGADIATQGESFSRKEGSPKTKKEFAKNKSGSLEEVISAEEDEFTEGENSDSGSIPPEPSIKTGSPSKKALDEGMAKAEEKIVIDIATSLEKGKGKKNVVARVAEKTPPSIRFFGTQTELLETLKPFETKLLKQNETLFWLEVSHEKLSALQKHFTPSEKKPYELKTLLLEDHSKLLGLKVKDAGESNAAGASAAGETSAAGGAKAAGKSSEEQKTFTLYFRVAKIEKKPSKEQPRSETVVATENEVSEDGVAENEVADDDVADDEKK